MEINKKDWRLVQYKGELNDKFFSFQKYVSVEKDNDHDHCDFCSKKLYHEIIDDYCTTEGYLTIIVDKKGKKQSHWVCKECFEDFKDLLNLKTE